jgi:hypothetical protein
VPPPDGARSYDRTPPHGSLAEEAAKFADLAHRWLAAQSSRSGTAGQAGDVWAEATADGSPPECRGCPVCRVRRALSDVSPEVYEHLADAASSLGAALRALDGSRRR